MALVALVPGDAWSRPGLGLWTVRELVGHTARALGTVEEYLVVPPSGPAVADAVAYFRAGTAAGITNSEAVAERGRLAGRELGPRPVEAVAGLSERVLGLVEQTPDDATVTSRLGVMRLIDYLPTRTFELAVHGLDLNAALRTDWTVPRGPLA